MTKPKVLVCQHGARHRYAIPRMLEEAGMLAALYTDSSVHSYFGRVARILPPPANGGVHRLLQRMAVGIPRHKIYSSDAPLLSDLWAGIRGRKETAIEKYLRQHRVLSRQMIRWGLQDADAVISQSWEDYDFITYAKQHGKLVIVDVNSHPLIARIMAEELARFPDWGHSMDSSDIERREQVFWRAAELADVLLCPSEWVAEGVASLVPESGSRIRICPYGSSIDFGGRINKPQPGRVFFAGSNPLLKGLPDMAAAAEMLKARYPNLDFRIAGVVDPRIYSRADCRSLHFLGRLSWSQMRDEYLSADMFVLPTLSEGLAGVVLEAIAAGCPVITTRRAGIEITDSVNGILIPPRNPDALAAAIERLCRDRALRNKLAVNTKSLAIMYGEGAWAHRLMEILSCLPS